MDLGEWRSVYFFLLYNQYGGSGINISYQDVQEMEFEEIRFFVGRLRETRERESAALERVR